MKIDNSQTVVSFDFRPADYFLVYNSAAMDGERWTLNFRIDRSEKGKDDDVGTPKIYLADEEAETCKKAGFTWIEMSVPPPLN